MRRDVYLVHFYFFSLPSLSRSSSPLPLSLFLCHHNKYYAYGVAAAVFLF